MAATFSVKTYTISAPAGTGGTISPNGSVRVNHGSNQSFTITAGTGYHISDITVDGVSQGAISSYTFSNVTAGHTILASFSANTYTITASAGTGGTISPSGSVSVSHGASKTFTISANAGYQIASVTVDGASQGTISSYTFSNVTANHTMAATFSVKTYTISAPAGTGGTISPNGSVRVNHGSNQSFTITAGTGYHISDITVDGVSQGAISSYTFSNVTAGHTISAAFSAAPHLPSKNQNSQPLETPEHAAVTDIRFSQAESSVDDAAQSQNQKKETPHEKVATGGREAVRNNVEKERKGHQKNRPLFLVGATLVIVVVGLFSGWYFFIRQTPVAQQPLQKAVALATKENQGALVSQTAPSVKPSETNMIPASATPAPTARDTMELEERINTELKDKGIGSVSVKIGQDMKGVVRGQVNKEATKARALEIVSHNLLTNIDDRILVKTQKQKVDPGRLEKELNRALSNANLGTVTAEVNTAMVATLKGTVQSNQDKAKAVSITKSFKGLKSHKDIIFIILSR
jgi:osmotically-inducible protein OsmY